MRRFRVYCGYDKVRQVAAFLERLGGYSEIHSGTNHVYLSASVWATRESILDDVQSWGEGWTIADVQDLDANGLAL